QKKDKKD
uniref:Tachykinin-like peptide-I n=1 Tax=Phoneutria nigriventer TaxID=6918 RepID=TLP1_PHONI|nr:RecName: Full=Tachykinin-like peptide-I; AltName: Full=P.nigriventer tachykinin peptides I; Short=PnTkP-I; AltName: Full=U29-ctenitoxin-Pn1a; Short=U29-CNTX-Pn1a [Phoneutria nigriventer]